MAAKTEVLRAPRQVSPWVVIGAAAALIAGLAVITVSEPEVTSITRPPVAASTARVTDDVAEIAALKSANATRYLAEHFWTGAVSPWGGEAAQIAAVKAGLGRQFVGELNSGGGSGSEPRKGHPVRRSG